MKQKILAAVVAAFLIASCRPQYGCGTENYRHRFTVEVVREVKPGDTLVVMRNRFGDVVKRRYQCLPDSFSLGKEVML